MAVIDTMEGPTLFTVHNFPCAEPTGMGGTARMSFVLRYYDSGSLEMPRRRMTRQKIDSFDDINCKDATATTLNRWQAQFTDGFVLGPLGGLWQLDASFSGTPNRDI